MAITLETLIKRNTFDSYQIISAPHKLNTPITGASILETPDFEKYIIDGTLILTTFYIIKNDLKLFKNLLQTLKNHHSPGMAVKLYRYIDKIPKSIIDLADKMEIPIITLDYDVNLSHLYNTVFSEIRGDNYNQENFSSQLSLCMSAIKNNPSTQELINICKGIKDLEVVFYNYDTGKVRSSGTMMENLYNEYKHESQNYLHIRDGILYIEDIYLNDRKIYRQMMFSKNEKRYLLTLYAEIFNVIITIIYLQKREKILRQDQFLLNFISNFTSSIKSSEEIIEEGKLFSWKISFPIAIFLFSFPAGISELITENPTMLESIRTMVTRTFSLGNDELKFTFFDNHILYISNYKNTDLEKGFRDILELLGSRQLYGITISYLEPVYFAEQIPDRYKQLLSATNFMLQKNSSIRLIKPTDISFISLLKGMDSVETGTLVDKILKPILDYDRNRHLNLTETCFTYIQNHFNAKLTAEQLFIHYNTLLYRLEILEKLGYPLSSAGYNFTPLLLCLHIHLLKNKELQG